MLADLVVTRLTFGVVMLATLSVGITAYLLTEYIVTSIKRKRKK